MPRQTSSPGRSSHISPLQQLTVSEAAVTSLEVCVRRKLSANLPSCRAAGVECVPMVVEALGGWAPGSISTIRRIGNFLGQRVNSVDPSHSTKHLFGRLAIFLWRRNATMWLRRSPSLAPSSDGLPPSAVRSKRSFFTIFIFCFPPQTAVHYYFQ